MNVTMHNSCLWLLPNHMFLKDLLSHVHGFLLWQLLHQHLNCRLTFIPVSWNAEKQQKHRDSSQRGSAWQDFRATLSLEHQQVLPCTLPGPAASQGWNSPTNLSQLPYSVAEGTYAFSQRCNLCIWNEPFGNQRICIFSAKVEYSCCLRPSSCCCTSERFALLRTPD